MDPIGVNEQQLIKRKDGALAVRIAHPHKARPLMIKALSGPFFCEPNASFCKYGVTHEMPYSGINGAARA